MSSIFPSIVSGGVNVDPLPDDVGNVYIPNVAFTIGCTQTALPSNCTARVSSDQINGLVSELLALAEKFTPDGVWNCSSVTNVSDNLDTFLTAITGTNNLRAYMAIHAAALISADGGNTLTVGTDGLLYAP